MARSTGITIPKHVGEAAEVDYSGKPAADFGPLARDKIPVRSMAEGDLRALVAIDRRITGRDRAAYFQRKLADALTESDVRVSHGLSIEEQLVADRVHVRDLDVSPVQDVAQRAQSARLDGGSVIHLHGGSPRIRRFDWSGWWHAAWATVLVRARC